MYLVLKLYTGIRKLGRVDVDIYLNTLENFFAETQDDKSDLHYICNPVPKIKSREYNKFAIQGVSKEVYT